MKNGIKTLADLSNDVIPCTSPADVRDPILRPGPKPTAHVTNGVFTPRKARTKTTTPTPHPTLPNNDVNTKNDVSPPVSPKKSPADSSRLPIDGEKPHDLLLRLYEMWPAQLSQSYQPSARANPEATAEFNFRLLRKLHPPVASKPDPAAGLQRVKAAGVVVETVFHLGRKMHYNLKRSQASFGLQK